MIVSNNGLRLIEKFEGFSSKPYRCPAGVQTIGFGATYYPGGQPVRMSDPPITEARGREMLAAMLARYEDAITRYAQVELTQNQFDALVSWAYNVGLEAVRNSTLLRLLNAGDLEGAAAQFPRWDKAGGVRLAGLTRRRAAEQALFSTPDGAE